MYWEKCMSPILVQSPCPLPSLTSLLPHPLPSPPLLFPFSSPFPLHLPPPPPSLSSHLSSPFFHTHTPSIQRYNIIEPPWEGRGGGRRGVREGWERTGSQKQRGEERECGGGLQNKTCLNLGCLQSEMSVPWGERKRWRGISDCLSQGVHRQNLFVLW